MNKPYLKTNYVGLTTLIFLLIEAARFTTVTTLDTVDDDDGRELFASRLSSKNLTEGGEPKVFNSDTCTVKLTKIVVDDNSTVFNCSYGGWPRPNVSWEFSKDATFLHEGSSPEDEMETQNSSWYSAIVISTAESHLHSFNVSCIVTGLHGKKYKDSICINADGSETNCSDVQVSRHPPIEPFIANLTKTEGNDAVRFNCTYGGWPRPNVTWTFSNHVEHFYSTSSHLLHKDNRNGRNTNATWFQTRVIRASKSQLNSLNVTCTVASIHGTHAGSIILPSEYDWTVTIKLVICVLLFFGLVVLLYVICVCNKPN